VANATDIVKKGVVRWTDEFGEESSATLSAETRFYPNAMIGRTTGGYLAKFDDSQSMIFVGVVRNDQGAPLLPAGTAGDGTLELPYQTPRFFELAISGVAVTDIGKTVYASDDQTGVLTLGTTYANVVGTVRALGRGQNGAVASGIALVEACYDGVAGNRRLGAVKTLAATGNQTLSKWDIGKTIIVPNTAALSIILPPVADAAAGGRLQFVKTVDTNAATLDANASEEIDAATTLATIDAIYDCAEIVNVGTRWVVLNRDIT
jgi:hypothetical protein